MPVNITEDFVRQLMEQIKNENGSKEYLNIMSYVRTAKKHGVNAFTAIQAALNDNPDIIFE